MAQVGQPRCKTLARFDELMQCLDTDQPGPTVETKKIFEEDREFNQGAWQGLWPMACTLWIGHLCLT